MGRLSQIFLPLPLLSWAPSAMPQPSLRWEDENLHPRGAHCLLHKSSVAPALSGSCSRGGPQRRNPLHGGQLQWSSHAVLQPWGCGTAAVRSCRDSPRDGETNPWGRGDHARAPRGVPAPLEPGRVQRPLEWGLWKQPRRPVHVLPAVPTQGRGPRSGQGLHGEDGSPA